ncbi:Uncharacterised protein [Salmonella enterica subsp. arizonae]|uniref:Lipoprotein n=1 Tax=Salmonella enterica subsp. arizonae TaxID=59203 RepID=A0A2X4TBQ4_SALER|nr:Uncharacterised protein [Salmonella enterica subsp. arizonae]
MKKNIIMLFFFTSILTGCGSSVNNERLLSLNPGEDISGLKMDHCLVFVIYKVAL